MPHTPGAAQEPGKEEHQTGNNEEIRIKDGGVNMKSYLRGWSLIFYCIDSTKIDGRKLKTTDYTS